MSNVERLAQAGLIHKKEKLADHEKQMVESFSKEEVDALISVKAKIKEDFVKKHAHGDSPTVGIVF
jgi:hypothetical protein